MKLRLLQQARTETEHAAEWYEDKRPGLGEDFLLELETAYQHIEEHPHRYARITLASMDDREFRRFLLRRFPYKGIYEVRADEAVVVAVAHGRRKPNYWIERATD